MDNIELFNQYIDDCLSAADKSAFDQRLKSDKVFATDFKVFLFTVLGLCKEEEQDNIEFASALKRLSKAQLQATIGRSNRPKIFRLRYLRERVTWASSIAALLIIGLLSIFYINRHTNYKLDDTIVAYNMPTLSRGGIDSTPISINDMSDEQLKEHIVRLKEDFNNTPAENIQDGEDIGMQLAMVYLKLHDRDNAIDVLTMLTSRYADDKEFVAHCNEIISQLE